MRNLTLVCVALLIATIIVTQDVRIRRVTNSVDRLVTKLDTLLEHLQMSEPGQMYEEWWSGSPPAKFSVTTTFGENGTETRNEWKERHEADVLAKQQQNPPV